MTISAFKASLFGGGARNNQFRVFLTFPSLIGQTASAQLSQFLVNAASLPTSQIGVAPVHYHGRLVPLAGDRVFNPWVVTIYNDTNFALRNALEDWVQIMASVEENTGVTSHTFYTSEATVEQLDRNGAILKRYTFYHFFPQMVSDIPLAMSQNDTVEEFQVQFAYEHWEAQNIAALGSSINGGIGIGFTANAVIP